MNTKQSFGRIAPDTIPELIPLYNPDGMMQTPGVKIKSIWPGPQFTRIDFIYQSPQYYINGGWIQIDPHCYIQCSESGLCVPLIRALGIPVAPQKHYFKNSGVYFAYSLFFGALPQNTSRIHCIEKSKPGRYFNFYNIPFSNWIKIPHAADLPLNAN